MTSDVPWGMIISFATVLRLAAETITAPYSPLASTIAALMPLGPTSRCSCDRPTLLAVSVSRIMSPKRSLPARPAKWTFAPIRAAEIA